MDRIEAMWIGGAALAVVALAACGPSVEKPQAPAAVALPCLLWGDSLTSLHGLGERFPDCVGVAQVGLASGDIRKLLPAGLRVKARFVVISAGSNNPGDPGLRDDLLALRRAVDAPAVWVAPAHEPANTLVRAFAENTGDDAVGFQPGRDGVHPASYAALAQAVAHALKAKGIEP